MKDVNFELKVGIFVFIGLVILFIIVFSIGDFNFFNESYTIRAIFGYANGIGMDAPVRYAGVDVGEVDNIKVFYDDKDNKTKVEILAKIYGDVKMTEDVEARINTLGLLGEKYLEIYPGEGKGKVLKDGDAIIGHDPVPVERVTEQMKELADSAGKVLKRLEEGEGTVGRLLTDDTVYENLEAFTADIRAHPWKLLNKGKTKDKVKKDTEDDGETSGSEFKGGVLYKK
ncbi:MAG: MCE family protein [Candidatus Omnitrophica bacterium]|nr:MCE family protein [Candidatus Omnitrophota bacterium]